MESIEQSYIITFHELYMIIDNSLIREEMILFIKPTGS